MDRGAWWAPSKGLQRVKHDCACTHTETEIAGDEKSLIAWIYITPVGPDVNVWNSGCRHSVLLGSSNRRVSQELRPSSLLHLLR